MGVVTLKVPIHTSKEIHKACDAMKDAPTIPKDLNAYFRPVWIVIKNKTQFSINPDEFYFYSGCLHGESSNTGPYSVTGFGARNSWAGTTGGARFKIQLDEQNEIVFVVGFSNPYVGYYEAHIEESWDIKENGYKKISENGNTVKSIHEYRGDSSNDDPMKARLSLTITSGQTMTITVVEEVWEDQ